MFPFVKLPTHSGSLAASTTNPLLFQIPMGYIYDAIVLKLSASGGSPSFTKSHISKIRVRLGSKNIVDDLSGDQLNAINLYNGLTDNTGYLTIPFSIFKAAREKEAMRLGAVDTKNVRYPEFSLEVTPNGSQAGSTYVRLEAYGLIGGPKPTEDGEGRALDTTRIVRALLKTTRSLPNAGVNEIEISNGSNPANLLRMAHIFNSYVTELEIKKDRVTLIESMAIADYQHVAKQLSGRSAQSGALSLDFVLFGDENEALSYLREDGTEAAMSWKFTASQADTGTIISDIYSSIEGL